MTNQDSQIFAILQKYKLYYSLHLPFEYVYNTVLERIVES